MQDAPTRNFNANQRSKGSSFRESPFSKEVIIVIVIHQDGYD
jgi:hypothetical protein